MTKNEATSIETRFGKHLSIKWYEQPRVFDTRLRFLCDDVFGLLDSIRSDKDPEYHPSSSQIAKDDRMIIIQDFEESSSEEENIKAMKAFTDYHGECIIAAQVAPNYDIIKTPEVYIPIDFVDGLAPIFAISNHQHVKNIVTNEILPIQISPTGPRVHLTCKDEKDIYYSLPYLMEKAFKADISDEGNNKIWGDEFIRLCDLYEKLGFVSIQEYSQFEYSYAYVYGNTIGKELSAKAKQIYEESRSLRNYIKINGGNK